MKGLLTMSKMVELEVVKLIRVSSLTRKPFRIIPTKTRKVWPVFNVEKKVITSENVDS